MGTASCEQHSTFFVWAQPFHTVPRFFFIYLFYFFSFAHTNNYNTLHLQFITGNCYHLQKKKKRKDKVLKNTIV